MVLTFYLLPLIIYFTDMFFRKRKIRYIYLISFAFGSVILFGSLQAVLLLFITVFMYALSNFSVGRKFRHSALFLVMLVLLLFLPI